MVDEMPEDLQECLDEEEKIQSEVDSKLKDDYLDGAYDRQQDALAEQGYVKCGMCGALVPKITKIVLNDDVKDYTPVVWSLCDGCLESCGKVNSQ